MRLDEQQRRFAAHIRDPERAPAPEGVESRRLQIYRELFFNNLADLLAGAFPVCRRILGPDSWRGLVREFYAGHRAHTPYFLELPGEFLEWLRARPARPAGEPPFLDELAHYEWVELALSVSEAEPPPAAAIPAGDLADVPLEVSPVAWPLAYRWPVHRIGPGHEPSEPPSAPTFLLVYRDRADTVNFLEIGADVARLLEALDATPGLTARRALSAAGEELATGPLHAARAALADLLARGAITARPAFPGSSA